jgi:hypothetical protein
MNRNEGFSLNRTLKPLIHDFKERGQSHTKE